MSLVDTKRTGHRTHTHTHTHAASKTKTGGRKDTGEQEGSKRKGAEKSKLFSRDNSPGVHTCTPASARTAKMLSDEKKNTHDPAHGK